MKAQDISNVIELQTLYDASALSHASSSTAAIAKTRNAHWYSFAGEFRALLSKRFGANETQASAVEAQLRLVRLQDAVDRTRRLGDDQRGGVGAREFEADVRRIADSPYAPYRRHDEYIRADVMLKPDSSTDSRDKTSSEKSDISEDIMDTDSSDDDDEEEKKKVRIRVGSLKYGMHVGFTEPKTANDETGNEWTNIIYN